MQLWDGVGSERKRTDIAFFSTFYERSGKFIDCHCGLSTRQYCALCAMEARGGSRRRRSSPCIEYLSLCDIVVTFLKLYLNLLKKQMEIILNTPLALEICN